MELFAPAPGLKLCKGRVTECYVLGVSFPWGTRLLYVTSMTPAAPLTHSSHLTSLRVNSFVIQSAGDIAALPDTSGSSLQTFFSGEGNDGGCKVPAAPVLVCLSTSAHKWVPAANGLCCKPRQRGTIFLWAKSPWRCSKPQLAARG